MKVDKNYRSVRWSHITFYVICLFRYRLWWGKIYFFALLVWEWDIKFANCINRHCFSAITSNADKTNFLIYLQSFYDIWIPLYSRQDRRVIKTRVTPLCRLSIDVMLIWWNKVLLYETIPQENQLSNSSSYFVQQLP